MNASCPVCEGTELAPWLVGAERMMGLGGAYAYVRCAACGAAHLAGVPADLTPFYGEGYYSLAAPDAPSGLRGAYRRLRDAVLFGRARWLGGLVAPLLPHVYADQRDWFRRAGASRASRILDVGCGAGVLLRRLVDAGFAQASGVDPFVGGDIVYRGRVLVRRRYLEQVTGEFDLVMLHHSLEHVAAQRATMRKVAELLVPGGYALVRVPILGTWASERYGSRWVQLDAPRHLVLHTEGSLRRLAEGAGLRVEAVVHDSTGFSEEGSERYLRDQSLARYDAERARGWRRWRLERRAAARNRAGQGDQAAFYLRKA